MNCVSYVYQQKTVDRGVARRVHRRTKFCCWPSMTSRIRRSYASGMAKSPWRACVTIAIIFEHFVTSHDMSDDWTTSDENACPIKLHLEDLWRFIRALPMYSSSTVGLKGIEVQTNVLTRSQGFRTFTLAQSPQF